MKNTVFGIEKRKIRRYIRRNKVVSTVIPWLTLAAIIIVAGVAKKQELGL